MSLLNALLPLPEDGQIESVEYLTPEMVPENPAKKDSIVDVRCKDQQGRQFIVEMQLYWNEWLRFLTEIAEDTVEAPAELMENEATRKALDLAISKVNQKTALMLNEQGTQAAAVTEVELAETSAGNEPQPIYFILNRPFAFLIKENSTGAILFAGAINKL